MIMPAERATMLLPGAEEIAPCVVLLDHFILARPCELAADKKTAEQATVRGRCRLRKQARKITADDRPRSTRR